MKLSDDVRLTNNKDRPKRFVSAVSTLLTGQVIIYLQKRILSSACNCQSRHCYSVMLSPRLGCVLFSAAGPWRDEKITEGWRQLMALIY